MVLRLLASSLVLVAVSPAWPAAGTRQERILDYQTHCEREARREGAPVAFARNCCDCLSRHLETMEVLPADTHALQAFTQQHLQDCIIEAILQFSIED